MDAARAERIRAAMAKAAGSRWCGEFLASVVTDDEAPAIVHGSPDRPFFIASATKLYVTAIAARLRASGDLDWDAPFADYLTGTGVGGLCVVDGVDHTPLVTVRQLLAHTSGIPDYFEGRRPDGTNTFLQVLAEDFAWGLDDVIGWTREMPAPFAPGTPGRALYSDTNYQLLGAIIERVTGMSFAAAVQAHACDPLGLGDTWCMDASSRGRYDQVARFRVGDMLPAIPLAMSSVGADGGVVSTLRDSQRFLRALLAGELFDRAVIGEITAEWRRIFRPLRYGTGIMLFRLPRVMAPFGAPDFIGHSGASGTVMFGVAGTGTTIVLTTNQAERRDLPFRMMVSVARR